MSIREVIDYITTSIEGVYPREEARAIAYRLLDDGYGIGRKEMILEPEMVLSEEQNVMIQEQITQLKAGRPIQYVIGFTEFYSRRFEINSSALIPRNETEILILQMVKDYGSIGPLRILDIGTGSGAIAITLALEFPNSVVEAWDISDVALELAEINAKLHGVQSRITFRKVDVLNEDLLHELINAKRNWNVIVSNPPYVTDSERESMHQNVIGNEPHSALFVSDSDPLIFYRVIAELASKTLTSGGGLYFEINHRFGNEMKELLSLKFENIKIIKDFHDVDRIVSCNVRK